MKGLFTITKEVVGYGRQGYYRAVFGAKSGGNIDELPAIERRIFICRYWYFDDIAAISKQFGFSSKINVVQNPQKTVT